MVIVVHLCPPMVFQLSTVDLPPLAPIGCSCYCCCCDGVIHIIRSSVKCPQIYGGHYKYCTVLRGHSTGVVNSSSWCSGANLMTSFMRQRRESSRSNRRGCVVLLWIRNLIICMVGVRTAVPSSCMMEVWWYGGAQLAAHYSCHIYVMSSIQSRLNVKHNELYRTDSRGSYHVRGNIDKLI